MAIVPSTIPASFWGTLSYIFFSGLPLRLSDFSYVSHSLFFPGTSVIVFSFGCAYMCVSGGDFSPSWSTITTTFLSA